MNGQAEGRMKFDFHNAEWIYKPKKFTIENDYLEITTEPDTDFWQRTFYGFRNDNAPGLLMRTDESFTFTVKTSFKYGEMFDQCGLLIYLDSENWVKAGLEYENKSFSRLGSVVTNLGYSDWATTDLENQTGMYYRLNRRGPDFLIESSFDGLKFSQMRIFHMHALGETTEEMGRQKLMSTKSAAVKFGIYACSPLNSSFTARFSEIDLTACSWQAH